MPPALKEICRGLRSKHFPRGQIMLYQDDAPQDLFILQAGTVKVYDIDDEGNEKILHLFNPPAVMPFDFFGHGNSKYIKWFYAALTDCDVYTLPSDRLTEQIDQNGELATYLTDWFSAEANELLVRLSSLGKTTAGDKVAAALKFLSVRHANQRRSGWRRVAFPVNQQLLADMTGVTRESTALIMKGFRDRQVVRYPRQTILEINPRKLLR